MTFSTKVIIIDKEDFVLNKVKLIVKDTSENLENTGELIHNINNFIKDVYEVAFAKVAFSVKLLGLIES